ncbi:hypothetical protein HDU85_006029 [Gaertneriomyces sp. JEL0708]|nr:hypothetical protein HDU85_006029 [Gaertneriomyces sp. JEL0708]
MLSKNHWRAVVTNAYKQIVTQEELADVALDAAKAGVLLLGRRTLKRIQEEAESPTRKRKASAFLLNAGIPVLDTPPRYVPTTPTNGVARDRDSINHDKGRTNLTKLLLELCDKERIINSVDVVGKLRKIIKHSMGEGKVAQIEHTEEFLAGHKCLFIPEAKPQTYHKIFNDEEYANLRRAFSGRQLELPDDVHDMKVHVKLLREAVSRVPRGAYFPVIESMDPSECLLGTCLLNMYQAMEPREPEIMNEATWIPKFIGPLLTLLGDADIGWCYDSTTSYNPKRPDVFMFLRASTSDSPRAICNWEVKTPWAGNVEQKKDLGRALKSCILYLEEDAKLFTWTAPAQTKLAVHAAGRSLRFYEVFMYPELHLAVEIGHMTLPTSLERGNDTMVAEGIAMASLLMARIKKLKNFMLAHVPKCQKGQQGQEDDF